MKVEWKCSTHCFLFGERGGGDYMQMGIRDEIKAIQPGSHKKYILNGGFVSTEQGKNICINQTSKLTYPF